MAMMCCGAPGQVAARGSGLRALAVAAMAWACAVPVVASGPVDEQAVSIPPGQIGLIQARVGGGVARERPPWSGAGAGGLAGALAERVGASDYDPCDVTTTHAGQAFTGGTYALQAGFTEHESLAGVFYFDPSEGPITLRAVEQIFLTRNATTATTTELTFTVWNGLPGQSEVVLFEDTDGATIPHLTMPAGTSGVLYSLQVDPTSSEQYVITGEAVLLGGVPKRRFSVGIEIRRHNNQGSIDPCVQGPSTARNAFPATDNTASVCGAPYAQLNSPSNNWLLGVNCGPAGCPANGGWSTFAALSPDVSILGQCASGCRPRGDWMLRARYSTAACVPGGGACCFPNGLCAFLSEGSCTGQDGKFQGEGTTCAETGCALPECPVEYNRDGQLNLDDLAEFITDFYASPAIPGGFEANAPTYWWQWTGFGWPCPLAGDAPVPFVQGAYRERGFRAAYSADAGNQCPQQPEQFFPNLDHLADYITAYYQQYGLCP